MKERRSREHFRGEGPVPSEIGQEAPEGGIGYPRHGCEKEGRCDGLAIEAHGSEFPAIIKPDRIQVTGIRRREALIICKHSGDITTAAITDLIRENMYKARLIKLLNE